MAVAVAVRAAGVSVAVKEYKADVKIVQAWGPQTDPEAVAVSRWIKKVAATNLQPPNT